MKISKLDMVGVGIAIGAVLVEVLTDKKKVNKRHTEKEIHKQVIEKEKNGIKIRHEVYDDGYVVTTTTSPDGFRSVMKYNHKKNIDYSYTDTKGEKIKYHPNGEVKEHITPNGYRFIYNKHGVCTYKEKPDGRIVIFDDDGIFIKSIDTKKQSNDYASWE